MVSKRLLIDVSPKHAVMSAVGTRRYSAVAMSAVLVLLVPLDLSTEADPDVRGPNAGSVHGPEPDLVHVPKSCLVHGLKPCLVYGLKSDLVRGLMPYLVCGPKPYLVHGPKSDLVCGLKPYLVWGLQTSLSKQFQCPRAVRGPKPDLFYVWQKPVLNRLQKVGK